MNSNSSENNPKSKGTPTIQSVARALTIIDCIAKNNGQLGLTELAKMTNLNKATAYGLLNTLEQFQYVSLSPISKKYHLSIHLVVLGLTVENNFDVRRESKPYVAYLADKYPCSAQIGIEAGNQVIYLLVNASAEYPLPAVCYAGLRAPCYCTGTGKAIMAQWSEDRIQQYLSKNELLPKTENCITDKDKFVAELAQIRKQGYAEDNEENQAGVVSYSAPIFNMEGAVVAAISVGIISSKISDELKADIIMDIKLCSEQISKRLGYEYPSTSIKTHF